MSAAGVVGSSIPAGGSVAPVPDLPKKGRSGSAGRTLRRRRLAREVGTAYASERAGLGLSVIVAIAIQDIPGGTSVAVPMESAGFGRSRPLLPLLVLDLLLGV